MEVIDITTGAIDNPKVAIDSNHAKVELISAIMVLSALFINFSWGNKGFKNKFNIKIVED